MNSVRIRRAARVACAVLSLLILSTAGLAALHSHQACTDDACPVCLCIHRLEELLRGLTLAFLRLIVACLAVFGAALGLTLCAPKLIPLTLVMQKIQMNN